MTNKKPPQLEFTDCLGCGKRVATTATLCRHCNTVRLPVRTIERKNDDDDDDLESHAALGYGGYDSYDLDEEEVDTTKSQKNLWWYVAWMLLVVFLLSALVPWWL